jgi:lysozyme family protein
LSSQGPKQSTLDAALRWLFRAEGGFVNNPKDPGGATNLGMSLRAVSRLDADGHLAPHLRELLDVDDDGDIDVEDVKQWTPEIATEFYRRFYWDAARCDELPWPLSLAVFDSCVLEGKVVAVHHLQQAIGLAGPQLDGILGPKTLQTAALVMSAVPDHTLRELIVLRLERLSGLHNAPTFFRGWAARMLDLYVEVLKEA